MGWILSFRNELIIIISLLTVAAILFVVFCVCVIVRWRRGKKAMRENDAQEAEKLLDIDEPSGDEYVDTGDVEHDKDLVWESLPVDNSLYIGSVGDLTATEKSNGKHKISLLSVNWNLKKRKNENADVTQSISETTMPNANTNSGEITDEDLSRDLTPTGSAPERRRNLTPQASYRKYSTQAARQEILHSGFKHSFASRAKIFVELNISVTNIIGTVKQIRGLYLVEEEAPLEMSIQLASYPTTRHKIAYTTRWMPSNSRSLMCSFILQRDTSSEILRARLYGRNKAFGKKRCYGEASFPLIYVEENDPDPIFLEARFLPKSRKVRKYSRKKIF